MNHDVNMVWHEDISKHREVELKCCLIDSFGEEFADSLITEIRLFVIGREREIVRLAWSVSRLATLVFDWLVGHVQFLPQMLDFI